MVLKRLGLRLAEDATKSACLREALAGEAKKHQAIHEKTVKAEGLAGRAKQLEKHIKGGLISGYTWQAILPLVCVQ